MLTYEMFSLVLAAQSKDKTETLSEVWWGIQVGKKILLSWSQGITKQVFTSAPPILIFQSPVIMTLS